MEYGVPQYAERKGSLLLRSNHCSFRKGVRNTNWHQMREAEPKDYDITDPKNYNLHTSTYCNGVGHIARGNESPPISEMKERMSDLHKKSDFQKKEVHKFMLDQDAFKQVNWQKIQEGGIVRHTPNHNVMFLGTTNREDYKPPFEYKPYVIKNVSIKPELRWRKTHSELYDTCDHRRWGVNTWQDEYRVLKTGDGPSTVIRGQPIQTSRRSPFSRYTR